MGYQEIVDVVLQTTHPRESELCQESGSLLTRIHSLEASLAKADVGSFHVEVVSKGTVSDVFLWDHSDKDVKSDGFKGTAIFVIGGKPHRIQLTPAGENPLSGTASVELPVEPKGAVQITTPTGSTVQAKF